jgi:hypothetical protein
MLLDDVLPTYDCREHHTLWVRASRELVYRALRQVTPAETLLTGCSWGCAPCRPGSQGGARCASTIRSRCWTSSWQPGSVAERILWMRSLEVGHCVTSAIPRPSLFVIAEKSARVVTCTVSFGFVQGRLDARAARTAAEQARLRGLAE